MRSTPLVHQQSQITNQQLRIDSVYRYEKDSMAISFRPAVSISSRSGTPVTQTLSISTANNPMATVFPRDTLVIERWHTRFKDHEVVRTDTLKVTEYQLKTETQKYVPRFYKWCTILFWLVVVVVIVFVSIKILSRIYLHR